MVKLVAKIGGRISRSSDPPAGRLDLAVYRTEPDRQAFEVIFTYKITTTQTVRHDHVRNVADAGLDFLRRSNLITQAFF